MSADVPLLLRGSLYNTSRFSKCPMQSICIVTKKCNNFDPHRLQCDVCESAVRPSTNVGGVLPEGEYIPDLQHAIKIFTDKVKKALADPDRVGQKYCAYDVTKKYDEVRKSTDMLAKFSSIVGMKFTEEVENYYLSGEDRNLLGRIE